MKRLIIPRLKAEDGVSALMITILLPLLFGFIALGVDLGHLYVVRNELQNAADAGALAGARFLLNEGGTVINEGCNQIAYDTAVENMSEKQPVEVWLGEGDVQRGHWSFGRGTLPRGFYPNTSTEVTDLWDVSFEELDGNPDFINAVRVQTRRETHQALSFFVRVFNSDFQGFTVRADAVAYLGFAGILNPGEADQPIGICKQSLLQDGEYSCSIGRFIVDNADTGGWTNFSMGCDDPASASNLRTLICANGNPAQIMLGGSMSATNGQVESAYKDFYDCWKINADSNSDGIPDIPWQMTLPVFDCEGDKVDNCMKVVGAVELNVLWIQDKNDPHFDDVPYQMGGTPTYGAWSSSNTDGAQRWNEFADHYNLQNPDGSRAPYQQKCIYFLPDCAPHVPTGNSGGDNFGIRAKIPVLVE